MTKCDVLGICGSLRAKSCNAYALAAAAELMPPGMTLRIASIAELPLYNQDVQDAGMPQSVTRLRDAIAQADALLIASPEYNFSVTGALKNAVDWLSRTGPQPFKDKPVAILSATAGPLGGARAIKASSDNRWLEGRPPWTSKACITSPTAARTRARPRSSIPECSDWNT